MTPEVLTAAEVAQRLRISRATVDRHARRGILPAVKIGGLLRFPVGPIEALERGEQPTPDPNKLEPDAC